MSTFTVDVNPEILAWARAELGIDTGEVAHHLKTDIATVEDWESHGKQLKYTDVRKIAKYYKRQIPVFFLKDVPTKVKKPQDFRNLSQKSKELHKDTLMAIRRTSRYLALYKESVTTKQLEAQYSWLHDLRSDDADTISRLRLILGVPVHAQRQTKGNVFKFWRERIEQKLNIFVFQFPIPNEEFDGFSYIEGGKPYAITLNSQISDTRKVFTIFHELGHIIEGESGICFTGANDLRTPFSLEAKCNHFAAEFLMPASEMIPPISFEELKSNADSLGVSAEAYLIRCNALKLLDDAMYRELMAIIQKMKKEYKKKEGSGAPPPIVLSKSQRGEKFFDFVIDGYDAQRLSASLVRDVLGLKVVGLGRQDS
jgi:Zn-dependent peptidase ImmA (M78 family)